MKESVKKKLRFNNKLVFYSLWILIVIMAVINLCMYAELRTEIDSMPHYECWNETFENFVNKNDTIDIYTYSQSCEIVFRNNAAYQVCDEPETYHSGYYYDGFEAECDNNSNLCYVSGIRELCKLDKYDALSEVSE